MPRISQFYGIVIAMFYNDHEPPHFHAIYGGSRAAIGIDGSLLQGSLPPRAMRMVLEWAAMRHSELVEDWRLAREHEPLKEIAPLD